MINVQKITMFALVSCVLYTAITFAESQVQNQEPNQPAYLNSIPPDKLKEDLDFLFKTIEEVHPNIYAYTSKVEFDPMREQLYKSLNQPINRLEFYKLIAPVITSLKSGHTFIFPPVDEFSEHVKAGGKVFPLSLNWDGKNAILVNNYGPTNLPIGGTILSINRQDAGEVISRLARYFPAERRTTFRWQLERDELLRPCIWLEYGPIESLDVRIRAIDESVNDYTIKFVTLDEIKAKESSDKKKNSYRDIAQYNAFLIKLNDWVPVEEIKKFCSEAFKEIHEQKVSNLIIDIRNNPGGNSDCAEAFTEYLTEKPYRLFEEVKAKLSKQFCNRFGAKVSDEMMGTIFSKKVPLRQPKPNPLRFKGQTFLLIGVRSTSTSTAFAAAMKHFDIGILVGEEPAEPLTCYGNAFDYMLPNCGLKASSACQVYVFPGSKNDGRGVLPNYEVKQNPQDTTKGVDTVLEFTLNLIKEGGQFAQPKQER